MSLLIEKRRRLFMLIVWLFGLGAGVFVHMSSRYRQTMIVEGKEVVLIDVDKSDPRVMLGIIICGAFSIYYAYRCWNPPSDP